MIRFQRNYLSAFIVAITFIFGDNAEATDCRQASTKTEKLICSTRDTELKWLDDLLNAEYRLALSRTETYDSFRASQRKWIKQKRDTCTDGACLRRVYVDRIAEISKSVDSIEGVYLTNGACVTEPWQDKKGEFIGKDCKPQPINFLKIERIPGEQYRVISEVHQFATGNFDCSADAHMHRKGSTLRLVKWTENESNLNQKCPFSVEIKSDRFLIHTGGEQCDLCGLNGNFDGESFPRASNAK